MRTGRKEGLIEKDEGEGGQERGREGVNDVRIEDGREERNDCTK